MAAVLFVELPSASRKPSQETAAAFLLHPLQLNLRMQPLSSIGFWRLAGSLRDAGAWLRQGATIEDVRAQSINGWNPFKLNILRSYGPALVVPDPRNPSRLCHLSISEAEDRGSEIKFAALLLDNIWWIYVPAINGEEGAFEPYLPRHAGHWRAQGDEDNELPWPQPDPNWDGKTRFLAALTTAESMAEKIAYRGVSLCRLCGCMNGHEAFRLGVWEWPEGFRHYIEKHNVRPTAEFEAFILPAQS